MVSLSQLEDVELVKRLLALKEDLEELETEKRLVMGQTGLHISSSKVAAQTREFEEQIHQLQEAIAETVSEISRRGI